MAAETVKFKIDDTEFELPEIDDLDMDEWEIVYDRTGLILEDFAPKADAAPPADEESDEPPAVDGPDEAARKRRVAQPGFTRAMLEVALRRANPKLDAAEIRQTAGEAKLVRVLEALGDAAGDTENDVPLESTPEPEQSSLRRSGGSNENESDGSQNSSETRAGQPVATGTSA